jgi:hypothetical protein
MTQHFPTRAQAARCIGVALGATALLSLTTVALRADGDPRAMLRTMSDYMAGQKTLSVRYDAEVEVITPDLQKIQFTASGDVRATRKGGYTDVELVFDGKTVTLHNRDREIFATIKAPGTINDLVQHLRTKHLVEVPGADLLLADSFEQFTQDLLDAKYVGRGIVNGVECEHLAFRTHDTDWQLWVEVGERPIPRKYVITSKTVAQAPQYTLRIKKLRTDEKSDPAAFVFKVPDGEKQVASDDLGDIDEVHSGVPPEAQAFRRQAPLQLPPRRVARSLLPAVGS